MNTPEEPRAESGTEREFPRDAEQARTDIELTREELGDTVQALAEKANVPERAKEQLHERTEQARDLMRDKLPPPAADRVEKVAGTVGRNPAPIVGAAVLAVILVRLIVRRRQQ
ncbi:DUF3618 domain-containing protein [Qaidamihabitans albus]|uniref:DUF3618 domain-containing protein n=1 Tax=Qaidamihabitans albus TaxID=2795733 RepID=UPI0018F178F8|nr:DUF3618 domain-containing protein [Qaidamihabitans albus]